MKSFIPSTCGCVHLQHTILCTWEASSLTLGCTWTVVTSPAHALSLSHTRNHTITQRQTDWSGLRGDQKQLTGVSPDLVSHPLLTNFWVDEHSSLCCGTHVLVNTTRATVLALAHGETKTQMLFSLSFFVLFSSYRRIRRGCGCRTTDYTSSLSFVIFQCRLGL